MNDARAPLRADEIGTCGDTYAAKSAAGTIGTKMMDRTNQHKRVRLSRIAIAVIVLSGIPLAITPNSNAAEPAVVTAAIDRNAETHSPQRTIEGFHSELLEIMKQAKELGYVGRIKRLTPLMHQVFDLDFMASKTVGRLWRKLSDEDKSRWIRIFARFTTANYAGRFTGYTGEEFVTIGVKDAPSGTQVVLTKIIVPGDEDVQLNYRMIERDGTWKVVDVFLNGTVSELALRRSEYSSALKRDGFEKLLSSVETKIADLETKGRIDG